MASVRILLLVTGGIAAYKACLLTRLLVQAGFSVRVAMTDAATHFVTPMTFEVLTGAPVATDLWGEGQTIALDHIEYARWADIAVVAPATANNMAKFAHGIADDMVTTQMLAFPGPVLMAPAMNDNMWRNVATQANRQILADRGVAFVGPGAGFLACGTNSEGRMAEPEEIFAAILEMVAVLPDDVANVEQPDLAPDFCQDTTGFWRGRPVTITAGPTYETIDPVRYLGNQSSGVFGYAIAAALVAAGAVVTLISGPVNLLPPRGLKSFLKVRTAQQMADSVAEAIGQKNELLAEKDPWLIMAAAVADYRPAQIADHKIKKEDQGTTWTIELERNPDILKDVVPLHKTDDLKVVGFALETEDLLQRAAVKLAAKKMDYIVANDPTAAGSGFGPGAHRVVLVGKNGSIWESESLPKIILARELLTRLAAENG